MPQVFKLGSYWVYFWTNEGKPLEPILVHISQGSPTEHSTKVQITSAGKTLLANNNSHIPERLLRNMMRIIEARSDEIVNKWTDYFGEPQYFI